MLPVLTKAGSDWYTGTGLQAKKKEVNTLFSAALLPTRLKKKKQLKVAFRYQIELHFVCFLPLPISQSDKLNRNPSFETVLPIY